MKRINPKTGEPFKVGEKRDDGFIFQNYVKSRVQSDGFFGEAWLSPEAEKRRAEKAQKRYIRKRKFAEQNPGIKRLNPKTGKPFMHGEKVNGKYFLQYNNKYVRKDGYMPESWGKWETYHRFKCKNLRNNGVYRAKKAGYKSDLTTDHIVKIFPKDFICPATGIKMIWGGDKRNRNSPSLDKIIPEKGYMIGNVAIISERANAIKQDATYKEIINVGKWLQKEIKQR